MTRMSTLEFPPDDQDQPEQNSYYLCRITANDMEYSDGQKGGSAQQKSGQNPTILLHLPEQFQFSVQSAYDTPFAQGLIDSEGIKNFSRVMGISNLVTQNLTSQVWQGTNEVSFAMTFELFATRDPDEEVLQPIKRLMMLTLPGVGPLGLLTPPGPTIDFKKSWSDLKESVGQSVGAGVDGLKNVGKSFLGLEAGEQRQAKTPTLHYKNVISLEIGAFLRFDSVVVETVDMSGKTLFDKMGRPIAASVNVSFKTFQVPTKNNLDAMFPNSKPTKVTLS